MAVEPWGFDFPVAPGNWLESEAEEVSPEFFFEVVHEGRDRHHPDAEHIGVWYQGNCLAVVVTSPDGARERFSWELPR